MRVWKPPKKETKGWLGISEDVYQSGKEFLPEFLEALKQLPSEGAGIIKNPERIPQNLFAGLAKGGAGILNTPGNIRDYLGQKDIVGKDAPSLRLPEEFFPRNFDYHAAVGPEGNQPGDALTQGIGSFAPYLPLSEFGALGAAARTGMRSGALGVHATGQNENPIKAALSVPAFEAPLHGAYRAGHAMRPRNALRGNLPAEEMMANVRAAEGTNTDLGSIIGSPTFKQVFENMSTKWPGSGSDELLSRMGQQVEGRAQGLLDESSQGMGPGDRNAQLKTALENAYETQRVRKNELYEPVNQLAESEGFTLDLPSFRQRTNQQLQQIENSPLLQYDANFRRSFNKLAGLEEGASQNPSILETNITASALFDEGTKLIENKSASAKDRAIGRLYLDLANRARADIRNEMQHRGSPELNQAYNTATENYRENFSQFLDKDIYKLAQPGVEAETIINDIIKPGKKGDKFLRIEKIQNALPVDQRHILGNAWLRNSLDKSGELNPKQFSKLINDLGQRQFEALFPDPEYRQRLLDYGRLRGMNEKALSRMANPMTGQSLAMPGMLMAQGTGIATAITHGNPLQALVWALGPQVLSRGANRFLTSPAVRQHMVNRILQNEGNPRGQLGRRNLLGTLLGAGTEPSE
ncbi:MAG: hypothetical protein KBB94_10340 [Legionellaceae bacterium]|nr:hypothetical protein [Legionellaceae bacterium]